MWADWGLMNFCRCWHWKMCLWSFLSYVLKKLHIEKFKTDPLFKFVTCNIVIGIICQTQQHEYLSKVFHILVCILPFCVFKILYILHPHKMKKRNVAESNCFNDAVCSQWSCIKKTLKDPVKLSFCLNAVCIFRKAWYKLLDFKHFIMHCLHPASIFSSLAS